MLLVDFTCGLWRRDPAAGDGDTLRHAGGLRGRSHRRSRPDGRRITAADYLRREGIRELDLLVLTHLHLDHAGGLTHLLPGVRVREFWTNYLPPEEMWGSHTPGSAGSSSRRPVSDDLYGDLCKSPGPSAKPEDGDPADPDAL